MSLFCCPLCAAPLTRGEQSYRCPNGHSFDIAAAGYTHLLPANRKHSKAPGDDKEMVAALREGRPPESGAKEVKLRSRQYAKRQLTWFRRNPGVEWHLWDASPDFSTCLHHATDFMMKNGLV